MTSVAKPGLLGRIRAWFDLEWVFPDDLGSGGISEITPSLYLGGKPDGQTLDELRRRHITHIVSSIQGRYRAELSFLSTEFDHLFLETEDRMDEQLPVDTFVEHAGTVLANPGAKLYVHCEAGVSRSSSLVIALLMHTERLTFLEAFQRVRDKRVRVLPNIGFASQLYRVEMAAQSTDSRPSPSSLATYLKRFCTAPGDVEDLEQALERYGFNAPAALRSMYGGEIPRVVQGVRRS